MTANNSQKLLTTELPDGEILNEQEQKFLTEYLRTGNATQAARVAEYTNPGWTGWWVKNLPRMKAAIHHALRSKQIDDFQVLSELSELCYASLQDFMDKDGLIDTKKVHAKGHLVKKYKCKLVKTEKNGDEVYDVEIELHDRIVALEKVGRKYKMFAPDESEMAAMVLAVLARVLDSTLPKEQAGQVLRRFSTEMVGQRN
jgi:hypothetical protein